MTPTTETTPYALCQRYAAGLIGREETIRLLIEWPYKPGHRADPDDFVAPQYGTFEDVVMARLGGLIDADLYDEVLRTVAV